MLVPKTAYVNGVKVSGTILDRRTASQTYSNIIELGTLNDSNDVINSSILVLVCKLANTDNDNYAIDKTSILRLPVDKAALAAGIGLTADKIAEGVTILGVTGTFVGGSEVEVTGNDVEVQNGNVIFNEGGNE